MHISKKININPYNIFIILLVVGSIFYRSYFPDMPLSVMKRPIFYISLIVTISLFYMGVQKKYFINRFWFISFFLFLFIHTFHSFSYILTIQDVENIQPIIKKIISLISFAFTLLLIYFLPIYLISKKITLEQLYNYFYKAINISFIIVIIANIMQQLYIISPSTFDPIIMAFTHTIEVRWSPEIGSEFSRFNWVDGSYVKSNFRLNGMSEEAAENVALIFIAFLPFIFSRFISNLKYNLPYKRELIQIILSIIIFIIAKTTFGILFAVLSVIILLFILSKYNKKIFFIIFSTIILFLLPLGILALSQNEQLAFYITKVTDLDVTSTNSRLGVTIALAQLGLNYPLIGVGNNAIIDLLLPMHLPLWTQGNHEIQLWVASGHISPLSVWLHFFSTYGILSILLFVFFFYSIYYKLKSFNLYFSTYLSSQIYLSYLFYIVFMSFAMIFHIAWYKSIYIIIASLFVVISTKLNPLSLRINKDYKFYI